jgi:hypothetical protein
MALSTTTLAADHAAILADLPETATIGATSYSCNRVSMQSRSLELQAGRFIADYGFSLSFAASELTTDPAIGSTLTYSGVVFRVIGTDLSPDGVERRVHLASRYSQRTTL